MSETCLHLYFISISKALNRPPQGPLEKAEYEMHLLPGVAVPFGPGGQQQWGAGGRFGYIRGTRLLASAPCPARASLLPLCLPGACPFQSTHDSRTQTGRRESYGSRRPQRPRSPGVVSGPHRGSGACWKSHVKGHLRQLATVGTRELPHLSRSPCPCRMPALSLPAPAGPAGTWQ